MVVSMVKKIDVKKVTKLDVSSKVLEALETLGFKVSDGEGFGFTEGTLVAHMDKCDIQIKFISPKAGIERYEKVEEDEAE